MASRFVHDWLEGWSTRDVERIMAHYDEAATFQSPSVLALQPASNGVVSGRDAIRELSISYRWNGFPRYDLNFKTLSSDLPQ